MEIHPSSPQPKIFQDSGKPCPEMTGDELPIQDAQDLLPGTRSTGTGSTLVVGSPGQCHGQPGPWRSTGLACSSGY